MTQAVGLLVTTALVVGGLVGGDVIRTGLDPEDEIAAVEEVALGYGESEGAEACEFMSASALDQLGGQTGCARRFEPVPPAVFDVQEVTIEGNEATAAVENVEEQNVIELGFVKEYGEWKLSSFPGLETIQPPPVPEELAPTVPETVPEETTEETAPETDVERRNQRETEAERNEGTDGGRRGGQGG